MVERHFIKMLLNSCGEERQRNVVRDGRSNEGGRRSVGGKGEGEGRMADGGEWWQEGEQERGGGREEGDRRNVRGKHVFKARECAGVVIVA